MADWRRVIDYATYRQAFFVAEPISLVALFYLKRFYQSPLHPSSRKGGIGYEARSHRGAVPDRRHPQGQLEARWAVGDAPASFAGGALAAPCSRAKRRWGELLGPAENRGPATVTAGDGSGADRESRRRARKLAAIPEQTFEAALKGDAEQMPSEAALARRPRLDGRRTGGRLRSGRARRAGLRDRSDRGGSRTGSRTRVLRPHLSAPERTSPRLRHPSSPLPRSLQSRLHQFDSGRRLFRLSRVFGLPERCTARF